MTINEAFNKVKSICFTRIVELETEAEKIKDIMRKSGWYEEEQV